MFSRRWANIFSSLTLYWDRTPWAPEGRLCRPDIVLLFRIGLFDFLSGWSKGWFTATMCFDDDLGCIISGWSKKSCWVWSYFLFRLLVFREKGLSLFIFMDSTQHAAPRHTGTSSACITPDPLGSLSCKHEKNVSLSRLDAARCEKALSAKSISRLSIFVNIPSYWTMGRFFTSLLAISRFIEWSQDTPLSWDVGAMYVLR